MCDCNEGYIHEDCSEYIGNRAWLHLHTSSEPMPIPLSPLPPNSPYKSGDDVSLRPMERGNGTRGDDYNLRAVSPAIPKQPKTLDCLNVLNPCLCSALLGWRTRALETTFRTSVVLRKRRVCASTPRCVLFTLCANIEFPSHTPTLAGKQRRRGEPVQHWPHLQSASGPVPDHFGGEDQDSQGGPQRQEGWHRPTQRCQERRGGGGDGA